MTIQVKHSGLWKPVTEISVNVAGVWKQVKEGWVKDGTWKQFFAVSIDDLTMELDESKEFDIDPLFTHYDMTICGAGGAGGENAHGANDGGGGGGGAGGQVHVVTNQALMGHHMKIVIGKGAYFTPAVGGQTSFHDGGNNILIAGGNSGSDAVDGSNTGGAGATGHSGGKGYGGRGGDGAVLPADGSAGLNGTGSLLHSGGGIGGIGSNGAGGGGGGGASYGHGGHGGYRSGGYKGTRGGGGGGAGKYRVSGTSHAYKGGYGADGFVKIRFFRP